MVFKQTFTAKETTAVNVVHCVFNQNIKCYHSGPLTLTLIIKKWLGV